MKPLFVAFVLLVATNVFAKDPISQSQFDVQKYANAVNSAAMKIDSTKGTQIDRMVLAYKNPAEKLGYDFDKTVQLYLNDGIKNYTLYEIILRPVSVIREDLKESLEKNLTGC